MNTKKKTVHWVRHDKKDHPRWKVCFIGLVFLWMVGAYFLPDQLKTDVNPSVRQADIVQMNVG